VARRLTVLTLGVLPALLALLAIVPYGRTYAFDFHVFVNAARDFLDGRSPYPHLTAAALAGKDNFVYPAPMAAVMVPFALLPHAVGAALWSLLLLACVPAALYVLGVRDWRCYGASLLWLPTLVGIRLGSISPLLLLGLAVLWRYRDRAAVSVPVLAALVVSKLFLFPLLVWFVLSRRSKAAAGAVLCGAAASLLASAVVGFDSLSRYPHLLSLLARVEQRGSFSPLSLGLALGLPLTAARVLVAAAALAVLATALVVARRAGRPEEADRKLLIASLGLAFVLSPILWGHYLVLLLVVLALSRPVFSLPWLLPLWIFPDQTNVWILGLALATVVAELAWCWARPSGTALAEGGVYPVLSAEAPPFLSELRRNRQAVSAEASTVAASAVGRL
jgi:alpha-1,2-mannosyltransferase